MNRAVVVIAGLVVAGVVALGASPVEASPGASSDHTRDCSRGEACIADSLRNVPLGILIAKNKLTGADVVNRALRHAERERRDFLAKGVHILVLSGEDLHGKSRELRGLEASLIDDYEHLRFGRRS
jgi:hypothetical protein